MFHHDRVWCVTRVESAQDLARRLTESTWTCCTAFSLGGYLWLNDATSSDAGQEYSLYRSRHNDEALAHVQRTLRGDDDRNDFAREVYPHLQTLQEHGRCSQCAGLPLSRQPRVERTRGFSWRSGRFLRDVGLCHRGTQADRGNTMHPMLRPTDCSLFQALVTLRGCWG